MHDDVGQMIRAPGGVLWRIAERGTTEVALVHRPRYGDWSLLTGILDVTDVCGALLDLPTGMGLTQEIAARKRPADGPWPPSQEVSMLSALPRAAACNVPRPAR